MTLSEVVSVLERSTQKELYQRDFVDNIKAKADAGETALRVYVDGSWFEQDLNQFLESSKSTLARTVEYNVALNNLHSELTSKIDEFVAKNGEFVADVNG